MRTPLHYQQPPPPPSRKHANAITATTASPPSAHTHHNPFPTILAQPPPPTPYPPDRHPRQHRYCCPHTQPPAPSTPSPPLHLILRQPLPAALPHTFVQTPRFSPVRTPAHLSTHTRPSPKARVTARGAHSPKVVGARPTCCTGAPDRGAIARQPTRHAAENDTDNGTRVCTSKAALRNMC